MIRKIITAARFAAAVAWMAIITVSCGGDDSDPTTFVAQSGVAQKGPLQRGSVVTVQELDARLSPTGKTYSYQITSDSGAFSPTSPFTSQYLGVIATGYYLDELTGAVSDGPITLNGYGDLSAVSVLNVNLLTTLAYQRIRALMESQGMSFVAAMTQAENEVLAALSIQNGASYGPFGTLDISQNKDGDKILAAVSSLFVHANTSGELSALMASFQADIAPDGVITNPATVQALVVAASAVQPDVVAANLNQAYASAGLSFTTRDVSDWLDKDGDGVVGKFELVVRNATDTSTLTLPSFVISPNSGAQISVSAGRLVVNGKTANGPATITSGDVVAVEPPPGEFPAGSLVAYVLKGNVRIAKVTFVSATGSMDTWNSAASPITHRIGASATLLDTGKVLLAGGKTAGASSSATALTELYDPAADSWTAGANMASARFWHTATLLPDGTLLVTGGESSGGKLSSVERYDPDDDSWTAAASLPDGRASHVAVLLQSGSLLVVGGTDNTGEPLRSSVLYDPATDTWSAAASMMFARGFGFTATLLPNGKVLVIGGLAGFTAELYDPATNTWSRAADMPLTYTYQNAVLLPNGKVLVVHSGAHVYDPVSDAWSPAGDTATGTSASATLLPSGKVLVAGGLVQGAVSDVALYDPASNSWSPAASMSYARYGHTAVRLPDGSVLVVAGVGADNLNIVTHSERYW